MSELAMPSHASTVIFTYDDYLALPNDGKRYEIIEGELSMTPSPSTKHQNIILNLVELLRKHVRVHSLGKVFCSPIDVVFSMTAVVQPDIIFVSHEREHIITKKNIVEAPDLVIEILSESTEHIDRTMKKELYERYGVREYWIVVPGKQMIEVYSLQERRYLPPAIYHFTEQLQSPLFSTLSFAVKTAFEK